MNWQETVTDMGNPQIMPKIYFAQQDLLRQQAEISFKAGEVEGFKRGLQMQEPYLAGIREVVEWIEENIFAVNGYPDRDLWQSQLKVWGIE